jgi:hypothetical protein
MRKIIREPRVIWGGGGAGDREQRLLPADTQGGGVCDSGRTYEGQSW